MTAPVLPGETLDGKYRIERVLGEGGMGVVVAARHTRLDERVAIKFLLHDIAEKPALTARFLREARAAAKIKSEHVARVFDVGTLPDGSPYMVLEYLEGMDLAALLSSRGPLPIVDAIEYVLQACEAVSEAHALGIVHRDLKPGNLFLAHRPDGSPCVKVLDFGISKMSGTGPDAAMTKSTAVIGSPIYMSPEQLASARDVDVRADIWSLGIVLHELITGSQPFTAEGLPQLCMKIVNDPAPPLREGRPDAPAGLDAVVARCLEKDRAKRYEDVAGLAQALREFAPARARVSVDRVLGISGRRRQEVTATLDTEAEQSPAPVAAPSSDNGAPDERPVARDAAASPATPSSNTDATWGTTAPPRPSNTAETPAPARSILWRAVAAAGVALAVIVGVVAMHPWGGAAKPTGSATATSTAMGAPSELAPISPTAAGVAMTAPSPTASAVLPMVVASTSGQLPAAVPSPLPAPSASSGAPSSIAHATTATPRTTTAATRAAPSPSSKHAPSAPAIPDDR